SADFRGNANAVGGASVTFPLTPALSLRDSLRERENPPLPFSTTQRGVRPTNFPNNRTCRRLFPLPAGEGRGEGNRHAVRHSDSDASRNCRTSRVLRQSRRFLMALMNTPPPSSEPPLPSRKGEGEVRGASPAGEERAPGTHYSKAT